MRNDIIKQKKIILKLINENRPKSFICKFLDCRPLTLDNYLKKWNINYVGNKGGKGYKISPIKKTAIQYMNSTGHISSYKLGKKLIEDGLKEKKCECCNLTKWINKDIPLELHHKDGNRFNNELQNLQLLCPNCHALTENYGSKNKKNKNGPFV